MKRLTRFINKLLARSQWPLGHDVHDCYFAGARRINRGH